MVSLHSLDSIQILHPSVHSKSSLRIANNQIQTISLNQIEFIQRVVPISSIQLVQITKLPSKMSQYTPHQD